MMTIKMESHYTIFRQLAGNVITLKPFSNHLTILSCDEISPTQSYYISGKLPESKEFSTKIVVNYQVF